LRPFDSRRPSLCFTSGSPHQAWSPVPEVQRACHEPGEGNVHVQLVPMEAIAAGRDSNVHELLGAGAGKACDPFSREPEGEAAAKLDQNQYVS